MFTASRSLTVIVRVRIKIGDTFGRLPVRDGARATRFPSILIANFLFGAYHLKQETILRSFSSAI